MKLDSKVKGGLAWAGLVVILAVPAANLVIGSPNGSAAGTATVSDAATKPALKLPALKTPATDPIETASVAGDEAVDKLLAKGKKLPSYISDANQAVAPKPAAVTPVKVPTEVAIVAPTQTPPVPLPRSARPKATEVASLPAAEQPLIVDENKLPQQNAATEPFPLSDDGDVVTGDQLEEWDSGSLADYLAKKGLLSDSSTQASDDYDADGFYLDEGPNRQRPQDDFFLF